MLSRRRCSIPALTLAVLFVGIISFLQLNIDLLQNRIPCDKWRPCVRRFADSYIRESYLDAPMQSPLVYSHVLEPAARYTASIETINKNVCYPLTHIATEMPGDTRIATLHRAVNQMLRSCEPIAAPLHVVLVVFNPTSSVQRYSLARDFIRNFGRYDEAQVQLYVVELAYGSQSYNVTTLDDPRHLQLRTVMPLWHKENLINLAIEQLLPPTWQAVAWVDCEIEFEDPRWPLHALKILNGGADIAQLFSYGVDLGDNNRPTRIYTGFGYNHIRRVPYQKAGPDMWHPGYAWACTRAAYDQVGGLFEGNILGGGDQSLAYAALGMHAGFPGNFTKIFPSKGYRDAILAWETRFTGLQLGYVPGVVRHHYHGPMENRKYWERRDILAKALFDPAVHIQRDKETGALTPTSDFPKDLGKAISAYLLSRDHYISVAQGSSHQLRASSSSMRVISALSSEAIITEILHVLLFVYPPPQRLGPNARSQYDAHIATQVAHFVEGAPAYSMTVYVVEFCDENGHFHYANIGATHHVCFCASNMDDLGQLIYSDLVARRLPSDWEHIAYVDARCTFENVNWVTDTIRTIHAGSVDVVELYSQLALLDIRGNTIRVRSGIAYETNLGPNSPPTFDKLRIGPTSVMAWAHSRGVLERHGPRALTLVLVNQIQTGLGRSWSNAYQAQQSEAGYMSEPLSAKNRKHSTGIQVGYIPGIVCILHAEESKEN